MKRLALCTLVSYLGLCSQANGQGGVISTVAGNFGSLLGGPTAVAVDSSGNLFVANNYQEVVKVSTAGGITTVAGNGTYSPGFSGDGGLATSAALNLPHGVAVDASGNLFIADSGNQRIRRVSVSGVITTVAGNGKAGFSGDGGPATSASLSNPAGIAVDASGNLFIADSGNQRIRKVSANGVITTVAGNGTAGFSGDGGPATSAALHFSGATAGFAASLALDPSGDLFFPDFSNQRIRKVSVSGVITTVAGNGTAGFSGDGGSATSAALETPQGVAVDSSGDLFIADYGNNRIRKVLANGTITSVAGNGSSTFSGDGGPATAASLSLPDDVAVDASGNLFIADFGNSRIREVTGPMQPSITPGGIVPLYSTLNTIQPGEWVSIYGNNLASSTVTWNGNFPTSLGGTSVTINGKPAYLWYVSPTQINLQTPEDTATGPVPVVVTTASGTAASTATLAQFAPSFLLLDGKHVSGIIPRPDGSGAYGGGSYDILGPTGNSLGYPTVAAKPGEVVELFAVGLGPTGATVEAGQAFSGAAATASAVNVLINDNYVGVTPTFAGLSGAGLYQINLAVPAGIGTGDFSLVATVGGVQTPPTLISLQPGTGASAPCANVGGLWSVSESGSYTEMISAAAETDTETNPVSGNGSVTITQKGCSIQYGPISETGLIGSNLTASQLASLTRTGTVSGNEVNVTGPLALVDTVASAQAGYTVTNTSSNVLNASGQVAGNPPVMTLNETGTFVASGTYSISGQSGSFTETITTSSTATFKRGGVITTVSGGLAPPVCTNLSCGGFSGDGGLASAAQLLAPGAVAVDAAGNLFIADTLNQRIRKVSPSGIITTVAGSGTKQCGNGTLNGTGPELCGGFSGDGGPATSAQLSSPQGVAVDASGNLYIADTGNNRIRKVSPGGIITTIAGNGTAGFNGESVLATSAELYQPQGVAVNTYGTLFIADTYNNRIRIVSTDGVLVTIAGSGPAPCITGPTAGLCGGVSGDGGPATSALLYWPAGIALDAAGNLFIADSANGRVRKVSAGGVITTVAGGEPDPCGVYDIGCMPPYGEGGPATSATLSPASVAVDVAGDLFIADSGYSVVRTVSASGGIITTVAGIPGHTGSIGGNGPAPATSADLWSPTGIALDASGSLFIADSGNNRVREVSLAAAPAEAPSITPAFRAGIQFKALASSAPLKVVISLH